MTSPNPPAAADAAHSRHAAERGAFGGCARLGQIPRSRNYICHIDNMGLIS
jgi:hypothetical protein